MLEDLVQVIETLKQRIREHGAVLRENETRTRMALIDPLLTALGWDVANPAVVTPEYNVSGRWADYALLGSDGGPAATLEAKKLGESLASHRMQMLNYSNASGVDYAGLTDGNQWELYEVFKRGQLEDRRVLDLTIMDAPAHESALQLLLLWRPNLASGQPIPANEPISVNNPAFTEPQETSEPSPAPLPPVAFPTSGDGWVPLSEFNPPAGASPPITIRFSDGEQQTVGRWNAVLVLTVGWLVSKELLSHHNVPVQFNPRTYLVNTTPVHPTGNSFVNYQNIPGTSLVVNTNLNAAQVRSNTRKLLEHCGINPENVQLQVGE